MWKTLVFGGETENVEIPHFPFFCPIPYFGVSGFPPEIPYFPFVPFFCLARPFLYVRVPERTFPGEVGFMAALLTNKQGRVGGFLLALQRCVGHSSPG